MEWFTENWMYVVAALVALLEVSLPFISSTKANGVIHGVIEFLKPMAPKEEEKK